MCTRQIWALGSCYSPRRCHQWVRVALLPLIWGQLTISATASIMIMVLMILMIIMIMVLTMVMMASMGKGWHQEKKTFSFGHCSTYLTLILLQFFEDADWVLIKLSNKVLDQIFDYPPNSNAPLGCLILTNLNMHLLQSSWRKSGSNLPWKICRHLEFWTDL